MPAYEHVFGKFSRWLVDVGEPRPLWRVHLWRDVAGLSMSGESKQVSSVSPFRAQFLIEFLP